MIKVSAETFSRDHRRLIQPYLHKLVKMLLRVPVQCKMEEIFNNYLIHRIIKTLSISLWTNNLKTFFNGLICGEEEWVKVIFGEDCTLGGN